MISRFIYRLFSDKPIASYYDGLEQGEQLFYADFGTLFLIVIFCGVLFGLVGKGLRGPNP